MRRVCENKFDRLDKLEELKKTSNMFRSLSNYGRFLDKYKKIYEVYQKEYSCVKSLLLDREKYFILFKLLPFFSFSRLRDIFRKCSNVSVAGVDYQIVSYFGWFGFAGYMRVLFLLNEFLRFGRLFFIEVEDNTVYIKVLKLLFEFEVINDNVTSFICIVAFFEKQRTVFFYNKLLSLDILRLKKDYLIYSGERSVLVELFYLVEGYVNCIWLSTNMFFYSNFLLLNIYNIKVLKK